MPTLAPPWQLRVASVADTDLIHRWMHDPDVVRYWDQAWPRARWQAELAGQRAGNHSRPCLLDYDGHRALYLEIYRVELDRLARYVSCGPADLGVHLAIGDPGQRGRGLGSAALRVVSDALLATDARVLAEPAVDNTASVGAFERAGFVQCGQIVLPEKRAVLMARTSL